MESDRSDYDPLQSSASLRARKRLTGYLKTPKSLISVLSSHTRLSPGAILLYLFIASTVYFDPNNSEYKRCPFTIIQMSELLNLSRNSISKWLLDLQSYGLVDKALDGMYVIVHFGEVFLDTKKRDLKSDRMSLAMREDFEQAWSELFPEIVKKDHPCTNSEQMTL